MISKLSNRLNLAAFDDGDVVLVQKSTDPTVTWTVTLTFEEAMQLHYELGLHIRRTTDDHDPHTARKMNGAF